MAERMVRFGPDEISISLNSPDPALHDRTRGVPGAFDKAVTALRLLLAARARFPERGTRIYVMGLVFAGSYRDLEAFYDLVLGEIGADKLKLNFLQPSFGDGSGEDRFFAEQGRMDPEELAAILRRCEAKYGLGFNPVWIENVLMYVRSVNAGSDNERGWSAATRTSAHICNTYERNIMVDPYGFARLCFSSAFRGAQLHERGDLRRFWNGADDIRAQMRTCNALCGISHSVRRESATLAARQFGAPRVTA
jgi:MoaA/NifB/PqqE/SkfB family radical SAM enzyme